MSARFSKPAFRSAGASRCAAALLCAALAAAPARVAAGDVYLSTEHRIAALEGSAAPEMYGSTALFAYRQSHPARYVALRLKGDPTLHVYSRETRLPSGERHIAEAFTLFVLTLDLSGAVVPADGRLLYRMCVDGTWMTDPANPARFVDPQTRVPWSVIEVDPQALVRLQSPEWTEGGATRFHYVGEPGRHVALVGDFNRWDPYMHTLAEVSPGVYSIELRMPAGPRLYMFLVDGIWTSDPLNPRRDFDVWGRRVCVALREPAVPPGLRTTGH